MIDIKKDKNETSIEVSGDLKEITSDVCFVLEQLCFKLKPEHAEVFKQGIIGVLNGEHIKYAEEQKKKEKEFEYPKQPKNWTTADDATLEVLTLMSNVNGMKEELYEKMKEFGLTKEEMLQKIVTDAREMYADKSKEEQELNVYRPYVTVKKILEI